MPVVLPSPDMYADWKSFAKALNVALSESTDGVSAGMVQYIVDNTPVDPGNMPPWPPGFSPIWLSDADANLYLANPDYDPPTAPDIVFIDTTNIANAAIATQHLMDGIVTTNILSDGGITTIDLSDSAVTSLKLANGAVNTIDLATGAVTSTVLADGAVIGQKLFDAAVATAKLADDAVNAAKIISGAVGTLELADLAISTAKIAVGAVGSTQIASASITTANIANAAITTALINDAAITTAKVGTAQITTALIGTGQITTALIGSAQITTATIANAAISTALIQNAAITSALIGNLAVGTAAIAIGAIGTAQIANAAINTAQIANAAVGTAQIGAATIVTALIGDAQIVEAKIADLAVNTAKMANLAVSSAKIANLAVGVAHIQALAVGTAQIADAAITNAKIGGTIQSSDWNAGTKQGWSIDKAGNISGRSIAIYDTGGNLAFGSSGTLDFTKITGGTRPADNATVGATLGVNAVGFGALAAKAVVDFGTEVTGATRPANNATVGAAIGTNLTGTYSTGNIASYFNTGVIGGTYIADAAIVSAKIGNLAVLAAHIADANITTAKIADAAITNAKIVNLIVDKLVSGTLDATIQVGNGLFLFTVAGNTLCIGNGFGTTDQFFLWFGPTVAVGSMAEGAATVYLKTNGDAYFGGSLSAGVIHNTTRSTLTALTEIILGSFTSAGSSIQILSTANLGGWLAQSATWEETETDTSDRLADPYGGTHTTIRSTYVLSKATAAGGPWTTIATYSMDVPTTSRMALLAENFVDPDMVYTYAWQKYWNAPISQTTTHTLGSGSSHYLRLQRTVLTDLGTGSAPIGGVKGAEHAISATEA